MAKVCIEDTTLTAIGDSIRSKTGKTELLLPSEMPSEIESIQSGGGDIDEYFMLSISNTNYGTFGKYIKKIPQIDTSNSTDMQGFFSGFQNLISIPSINTSKVTTMQGMFSGCSSLKTVPQLNADKVINIASVFINVQSIENIGGFLNLGKAYTQESANYNDYKLKLTYSGMLTKESLLNVINGLYDLNLTYDAANGGTLYTQILNLGATNKAKLTSEEIAIATAKGWSVN